MPVVQCTYLLFLKDGTGGTDEIFAAAIGDDGSVVLVGNAGGEWSGIDAGGGADFAAVKLDADGTELWRWQVRRHMFFSKLPCARVHSILCWHELGFE